MSTLNELIKDKDSETLSLSRTVALITFIVLSIGFIVACYKRITYEFFISYPIGVMIVFIPALVVRFMDKLQGVIKAWKGTE